jgi:hypothetical protein
MLEDRRLLALISGIPDWEPVGPVTIEEELAYVNDGTLFDEVGAIQDIALQPNNHDVMYIASVNGGIWRTVTGDWSRSDGIDNDLDGQMDVADPDETPRWIPLTDDLPSLSMGAIAFDLNDPNYDTLYAGPAHYSSSGESGEPRGLWRTTDGGGTWEELGFVALRGFNVNEIIARGDTILVATSDPVLPGRQPGLYRSGDGGNTWNRVLDGKVSDIVIDPADNNSYYAAVADDGVYHGTNDGQSGNWTRLTTQPTGVATSEFTILDTHSVTSGGTTTHYVYAATAESKFTGISRSSNAGTNWTSWALPTGSIDATPRIRHFAFAVSPFSPEHVAVAGTYGTWIRRDDGTWDYAVGDTANNTGSHADHRDLAFDHQGHILDANDGGIYRLRNFDTTQRRYESLNGNLQITEVTRNALAYDPLGNNDTILIGTQDNGAVQQERSDLLSYRDLTQGDGGFVAVGVEEASSYRYVISNNWEWFYRQQYDDQNNPVGDREIVMLANSTTPTVRKSGLSTTDRPYFGDFVVVPYATNVVTPSHLLFATGGDNRSGRLYESSDHGDTVTDITPVTGNVPIRALVYGGTTGGISEDELIFTGIDNDLYLRPDIATGFQQLINYSTAGGTDPIDIVLDPDDWHTVFVLDSAGRIWSGTNVGTATEAWNNLTIGSRLPTTLDTIEYADFGGISVLLAGGWGGVYRRTDINPANNGTSWAEVGRLPNARVQSVLYDPTDDVLLAATLGRGVWSIEYASTILPYEFVLNIEGDRGLDAFGSGIDFYDQPDQIRLGLEDRLDTLDPLRLNVFFDDVSAYPQYSVDWLAVEAIQINSKGGEDIIQIDDLPPGITLTVNAGDEDDIVHVSNKDTEGTITINGGLGNDWFNITPSVFQTIMVNGNLPGTGSTPGDTLNVLSGSATPVIVPDVILGNGTVQLTGRQDVVYTSIESIVDDNTLWPPDRFDLAGPNNSAATATDLLYGDQTHLDLSIHVPGDEDWFTWQATSNWNVGFEIYFSQQQGDLDLWVYDDTQTTVASSTSHPDHESVVFYATEGSSYYIRVYGKTGATTNPDYALEIDWPLGFPDDSYEPNDTAVTSWTLPSGDQTLNDLAITPLSGEFLSDDDWFEWKAPASGTLNVDIKFSHLIGNLDLAIFDHPTTDLDAYLQRSSSFTDDEHVNIPVTAGNYYYVRVWGLGGATNPDYDLIIDGPNIEPDPGEGGGGGGGSPGAGSGDSEVAIGAVVPPPNNSAETATDLGHGARTIGGLTLHNSQDIDWFKWTATATGQLTIDVLFQHAAGDVDARLYRQDGDTLTFLQLANSITDNEQFVRPVFTAEVYFVEIYGSGGQTCPGYTLSFTGNFPSDEDYLESNDNFATATFVGERDRVYRALTIHSDTDTDFFRWRAAQPGLLDVQIHFVDLVGDLDMELYDSDMVSLIQSASVTDNEQIRWEVEAGEVYFVRIYGFHGTTHPNYDLLIDGPQIGPDIFEPGDSLALATNLGMGDQHYPLLSIHDTFNDDYYVWTASSSGLFQVDLAFDHGLGDVDLALLDAQGNQIAVSQSTDDIEHVEVEDVLEGDTFVIRVYGYSGATSRSYSLAIDGPDIPPDVFEPNNARAVATPLGTATGLWNELTIHESGGADWFRFGQAVDGIYDIDVLFADYLGNLELQVYDSAGNLVGSSTTQTSGEHFELQAAGGQDYYARVFGTPTAISPRILWEPKTVIIVGDTHSNYEFQLTFAPSDLHGDYNRDGRVNAADYVLWRNTLGDSVSTAYAGADGNGNLVVDQPDYRIWKENFGRVATVPAVGTVTKGPVVVPASEEPLADEAQTSHRAWFAQTQTRRQTANSQRPEAVVTPSMLNELSEHLLLARRSLDRDADRADREPRIALAVTAAETTLRFEVQDEVFATIGSLQEPLLAM